MSTSSRTLSINGRTVESAAATIGELVEELGRRRAGTAVALNGEVVPRDGWDVREVRDGDEIEIVGAVQGG